MRILKEIFTVTVYIILQEFAGRYNIIEIRVIREIFNP